MYLVRLSCLLALWFNQVQPWKCMDPLETGKVHRKCTDSGKTWENPQKMHEKNLTLRKIWENPQTMHGFPRKTWIHRQCMDSLENSWENHKQCMDFVEKPGKTWQNPKKIAWRKISRIQNAWIPLENLGKFTENARIPWKNLTLRKTWKIHKNARIP